MSYVTGSLYNNCNMFRVLLAPFAAVFWGSHVLAAPEPPVSLSPDLVCMVNTRQTDYIVACCIAAAAFKL